MPHSNHRRLVVGGGVALALLGLWLGHTIEYVRVWGTAGLDAELFGSVHAYMLPLAAGLGLVGALLGLRLWQVWTALGRRLDAAQGAVWALLRGRPVAVREPMDAASPPSFWAGVLVAWPALAVLQIALYLFQENVEAVAAHVPAPGLGAITGVHALAPAVHAGVALALVLVVAAVARLVRRRGHVVAAVEAIARALLRALTSRVPELRIPPSRHLRAPLQLIGLRLQQRPPPVALLSN
ncbi:MAG: hypothetical protein JOY80_10440 [Candidatus Dormibacteraeota bacterium]|nr:hypothetical protein [Candidatus Dormibacteraeota bacterium]